MNNTAETQPDSTWLEPDGWYLHSVRNYGPLTEAELRAYFASGMVRPSDTITRPGVASVLSAAEAAAFLHVVAPSASAPDPRFAVPLAHHIRVTRVEPGMGWRGATLWLALLLVAVLIGNHMMHPELASSTQAAVAASPDAILSTPMDVSAQAQPQAPNAAIDPSRLAPPPELVAQPQSATVQQSEVVAGSTQPAAVETSNGAPSSSRYYSQAVALDDGGQWEALRNLALRWTQEQPADAYGWLFLGRSLQQLQHWDESLQAHLKAAQLAPNDFNVVIGLGVIYSGLSDHVREVETYQRALQIYPQSSLAWLNLGAAYSGLYSHDSAVSAWKSAAQFNPADPTPWKNIGWEYYRQNRFREAIEAYEHALKLAPNDEQAKEGLAKARQR